MLLKVTNITFAAAFVLATLVQYNDPDPYLWMPLYLSALASTLAFHLGRLDYRWGFLLVGISLVWALWTLPTLVQHPPPLAEVFGDVKMYAPGVEEAREFGGLLIVAAWVGTISFLSKQGRGPGLRGAGPS